VSLQADEMPSTLYEVAREQSTKENRLIHAFTSCAMWFTMAQFRRGGKPGTLITADTLGTLVF